MKRFTISLDEPPGTRWREVIAAYKDRWTAVADEMWLQFGQTMPADEEEKNEFVSTLTANMLAGLEQHGLGYVAAELESLAVASGLPRETLMLLQLSYESMACTAVVAQVDSALVLARTLDWDSPGLRSLTIEVDFTRGGKLLYTATTFAGYLGAYGVAVNYRDQMLAAHATLPKPRQPRGSRKKGRAAKAAKKRRGEPRDKEDDASEEHAEDMESAEDSEDAGFGWPIGFAVRRALDEHADFDSAVRFLSTAPLLAPCFFVVVGLHAAHCLTRSERGEQRRRVLQLQSMEQSHQPVPVDSAAPSRRPRGINAASSSAPVPSPAQALQFDRAGTAPDVFLSVLPPESAIVSEPFFCQANLDWWERRKRLDQHESLPRTKLAVQRLSAILGLESKTNATGPHGKKVAVKANASKSVVKAAASAEEKKANGASSREVSEDALWALLFSDPIWDADTIYATVMCPAKRSYRSTVHNSEQPSDDEEEEEDEEESGCDVGDGE